MKLNKDIFMNILITVLVLLLSISSYCQCNTVHLYDSLTNKYQRVIDCENYTITDGVYEFKSKPLYAKYYIEDVVSYVTYGGSIDTFPEYKSQLTDYYNSTIFEVDTRYKHQGTLTIDTTIVPDTTYRSDQYGNVLEIIDYGSYRTINGAKVFQFEVQDNCLDKFDIGYVGYLGNKLSFHIVDKELSDLQINYILNIKGVLDITYQSEVLTSYPSKNLNKYNIYLNNYKPIKFYTEIINYLKCK